MLHPQRSVPIKSLTFLPVEEADCLFAFPFYRPPPPPFNGTRTSHVHHLHHRRQSRRTRHGAGAVHTNRYKPSPLHRQHN